MNELQFDFWSVLLLLSLFLSLFITPFLFGKKKKQGKWLGVLVLLLVAINSHYLLINIRAYRIWPHFIELAAPALFLIGPLYYWYIKSLVQKSFKLKTSDAKHLILFVLMIFYRLDYYLLPGQTKIQYLDQAEQADLTKISLNFLIPIGIHVLQTLYYLYLAHTYLSKAEQSGTGLNPKFKRWLKKFTIGFSVYWLLTFLWLLYLALAKQLFREVDYVFIISTALLINVLAYAVVYHNREFSQYLLAGSNKKYRKSSLSQEQSKGLLKRIIKLMEEEKVYTRTDLKINDIAENLSISTNLISQVINQETNKNFYEFVNEYRIAEALQRLDDGQYTHKTILAIAMESGFSNKNTFNRAFKKRTGLTPSQYLKVQQNVI